MSPKARGPKGFTVVRKAKCPAMIHLFSLLRIEVESEERSLQIRYRVGGEPGGSDRQEWEERGQMGSQPTCFPGRSGL